MSHVRSIGHFPFATPHLTGDESGPGQYGLGWTLEEAMSRWWRVKTWRLAVTMSGFVTGNTEPDGMGTAISCEVVGASVVTLISAGRGGIGSAIEPLALESSLAVPTNVGPFYVESETVNQGAIVVIGGDPDWVPDGGGGGVFFHLFATPYSDAVMIYDPARQKFQPLNFLSASIGSGSGKPHEAQGTSISVDVATLEPPPAGLAPYQVVDATVTFDSRVFHKPAYVTAKMYDWTLGTFDVQLSATPYRFWEYRGTIPDPVTGTAHANVPLYNSVTGEPAISPITGVPFTRDEIIAFSTPEN